MPFQKYKTMTSEIRVRFAPSPTGLLHIGGLRTALYNYLFARHHGGTFVLRIEDTDQARYVEGAERDILESLAWAGLHPDEGPVAISTDEKMSEAAAAEPQYKGSCGPYHQSRRQERYARYVRKLVDAGYAYYAFDSVEEIEQMRERLRTAENPTPKYDSRTRMQMRNSLTLGAREVEELLENGTDYVIRLMIPESGKVMFDDLIRGPVAFDTHELDDQVLLKADGMPTYHLANVIDDHEMKISHVIRGEEWLSSAPKHLLLYQYFGWTAPAMAHLPLIMSPGGGKLSKRKADEEGIPVNVRDYRKNSYERDALVNFLALLGWSPGDDRELMSLNEMIDLFSLDRVGKSGSVFDFDKLLWFNEHYMRKRPDEDLANELKVLMDDPPRFDDAVDPTRWGPVSDALQKRVKEPAYLAGVVRLMKERVSRLPDFLEAGRFFFQSPIQYEKKALKKGWKSETPALLSRYLDQIRSLDDARFKADVLKQTLSDVVETEGVGFGKLMMPLRIAVTRTASGPDLFGTLELLGKEEVERRVLFALKQLGGE